MLYTFEQGSHLREAQIFTILVNLSGLQNYSFSFKAITLQGKIQEGQSINPRVIFHYVERSFCHHQHHLTWALEKEAPGNQEPGSAVAPFVTSKAQFAGKGRASSPGQLSKGQSAVKSSTNTIQSQVCQCLCREEQSPISLSQVKPGLAPTGQRHFCPVCACYLLANI